ncbi:uroporphyrinogen decarboxylase family protein [Acidobacteriota bacterium]
MTSKELMKQAMDRSCPVRVPVMCQMSFGHMRLQTGFSPSAFWHSGEIFAEGLLNLRKIYDFDGILISLHGHSPDWENSIDKIERHERYEVVYWKEGDKTIFPHDDLPTHIPDKKKSKKYITEIDPESLSDKIDYIPVSQGLNFPIDPKHKFDIIDRIVEKAGIRYSIHGEVTSPFDYFIHLFGISDALISLVSHPIESKVILQRFTEGVAQLALEMSTHSVDAIKISSPFAGSGLISPHFYKNFVLPYERQIAHVVRRQNVHIYTHTCGTVGDRLEMMVESGISGLECLDPPPLGNVDLLEAKKRIGHKVFIKGNIDPINVLLHGTTEIIKKDTKEKIRIGSTNGGYILSTACSIAPHTPRSHVHILREIADQ